MKLTRAKIFYSIVLKFYEFIFTRGLNCDSDIIPNVLFEMVQFLCETFFFFFARVCKYLMSYFGSVALRDLLCVYFRMQISK